MFGFNMEKKGDNNSFCHFRHPPEKHNNGRWNEEANV